MERLFGLTTLPAFDSAVLEFDPSGAVGNIADLGSEADLFPYLKDIDLLVVESMHINIENLIEKDIMFFSRNITPCLHEPVYSLPKQQHRFFRT